MQNISTMRQIRNLCVFSGSSSQAPDTHYAAARSLGRQLAQAGVRLIYGAGSVGLMGAVADEVMARGGQATGVIPQFMVDNGWAHPHLTELIVTADMHERKMRMAQMSDAVIALPGGVGTFEELFETITWKQLGLICKPIVIADIDGYYAPILHQLSQAVDAHYMRPLHAGLWTVCTDADRLLQTALDAPEWDPSTARFAAI